MSVDNIDDLLEEGALVTLEDIAKMLRCSRRVVYDWTRSPDLSKRPPFFQPGKKILFPKKRFVLWLITNKMRGSNIYAGDMK